MAQRVSSPVVIGREGDLAALADALANAAGGRASLTLVGGEAGVGKTRLIQQVAEQARREDAVVLVGECLELGAGEFPYAPIAGAMRRVEHPAFVTAVERLPADGRGELALLIPDLPYARPAEPAVSAPAGEFARGRLFELLLGLLRHAGARSPVLLVVEDIHWADRSTMDFLGFLVRNFAGVRIAVVATFRSDELRRGHPLSPQLAELARSPAAGRIDLERLDRAAVERLLECIAGRLLAPDLVDEIFARSQGNPFFAEELLAAQLSGDEQALPDSLRDALLVRVETLPGEAIEVLRGLAVLGRPAPQPLIGAVTGLDEPALAHGLRAALRGHVLFMARDDCFEFRHALVREAMYFDLLPEERRSLHRRAAEVLAQAGAPSADLVVQWRGAQENGPVALVASVSAGLDAVRVYAFAEAREHFGHALALWDAAAAGAAQQLPLDRVGVLAHCAEAARAVGDWDAAVALCHEALWRLGDGDPLRAAAVHERLGEYVFWDDDVALRHYGEALRLLPAGHDAERARVLAAEALALHYLQRWDEACRRAEEAVALARSAGARAEEAYARITLGVALAILGDPDTGEEHARDAKRVAEELRHAEYVGRAYAHLAEILRIRGRTAQALELMLEGERLMARLGMSGSFGNLLSVNAAEDQFQLGRWRDAAQRLERTGRLNLRVASRLLQHSLAGQLAVAVGDWERARAELGEARRLCDDQTAVEYLVGVCCGHAELALWELRIEDARAEVSDAAARVAGHDDPLYTPPLYALGVRVEAEIAQRARAAGHAADVAAARARADAHLARLDAILAAHSQVRVPPEAAAYRALASAERARLDGAAAAERWRAAARAWIDLTRPYPAAYARWREAEALLMSDAGRRAATTALESAFELANDLGARPLLDAIDALARAARLTPAARTTETPAEAELDDPLTPREHEVLQLIADGLTNRQIADRLFISERTAGVHVSHILAKLGAPNRVSAARAAQQLGYVTALHGRG